MGQIALKLTIEGAENVWVTSSSLAGSASDDRTARPGLRYAGIVVNERTNPREGTLDVDAITVQIVADVNADAEFSRSPVLLTYLSESITAVGGTTMNVRANGLLADNAYVHIGTECLQITDPSTLAVTVERAQRGTEAQVHSRAEGAGAAEIPVWSKVQAWEGRRVTIECAEDGATSTVFRGVIEQAPYLSETGTYWLIDIAHISKVLEQDVGLVLDVTTKIRGYRLGASSAFGLVIDGVIQFSMTGLYESEQDFIADFNQQLGFVSYSGIDVFWADRGSHPRHGQCTRLFFRVSGADINTPSITVGSMVDGFASCQATPAWGVFAGLHTVSGGTIVSVPLSNTTTLLANTIYCLPIGPTGSTPLALDVGEPLGFPRTMLRAPVVGNSIPSGFAKPSASAVDETKDNSIALEDTIGAAVGDTLVLSGWPLPGPLSLTITADLGDGVLEFSSTSVRTFCNDHGLHAVYLSGDVTVSLRKALGIGDLSDFVDAVIAAAPRANDGSVPYVTAADWDPSDAAVTAGTLGIDALRDRDYNTGEEVAIEDLIAPELQLLGLTIGVSSTGKIQFVPYQIPTESDPSVATIGASSIVTPHGGSGAFPRWITATDGIVSVVQLIAGKATRRQTTFGLLTPAIDPEITIYRDISSLSAHKNRGRGEMSIEPLVIANAEFGRGEAESVAARIVSTFGHPYEVVTIRVRRTSTTRAIYIGDVITFTSPHVPDSANGTRGVTARKARVIGRTISYVPGESAASIELTVMMRGGAAVGPNFAGYTPSLEITNASNVSGNTWDLTVTENLFAPGTADDTSFYTIGDYVMAWQVDDATPNTQTGTVTAISATVVRVAFTGTAPWGGSFSGTYVLDFANVSVGMTDAQSVYAYTADSSYQLSDGGASRIFQ